MNILRNENEQVTKIKLETLEDCEHLQDGLVGETISEGDGYKLTVSNAAGYMCHISLEAYVPCEPDIIHRIMRNPNNSRVFRDVKAIPYRHIVFDDPRGLRIVMAQQVIEIAILPFVTQDFTTLLKVTEDMRKSDDLYIGFEMVTSDIMSRFNGHWNLTRVKSPHPNDPHPVWTKCTLEQDVLPRGVPAWLKHIPILGSLLRGTGARAVNRMMEDLRSVVNRINNGEQIQKVLKNFDKEDFVIQSHFVPDIKEFIEYEEGDDAHSISKQLISTRKYAFGRTIQGALQAFQNQLFVK
eukprot:TRINITY_DN6412_c0_g1_i2.p1 TRINITY_DN6412_c0_g1~~TRINITY_DN6412_c0_g1_i2.p1  ORF type:complete len:296 (+),score=39.64 TRINITY_DN6412_c0_g1_i2:121-1008(+)